MKELSSTFFLRKVDKVTRGRRGRESRFRKYNDRDSTIYLTGQKMTFYLLERHQNLRAGAKAAAPEAEAKRQRRALENCILIFGVVVEM